MSSDWPPDSLKSMIRRQGSLAFLQRQSRSRTILWSSPHGDRGPGERSVQYSTHQPSPNDQYGIFLIGSARPEEAICTLFKCGTVQYIRKVVILFLLDEAECLEIFTLSETFALPTRSPNPNVHRRLNKHLRHQHAPTLSYTHVSIITLPSIILSSSFLLFNTLHLFPL